jgi:hypothetical protein
MSILRRKQARVPSKEQALDDARKATRRLRRTLLKARLHQDGKQDNPADQISPNTYLGGGGVG